MTLSEQLDVKQVANLFNTNTCTIWRWSRDGKLPKPRKFGGTATRWDSAELKEAIDKTPRAA